MKDWTPAEDFILKNSQKLSALELLELLPGRSKKAIECRRLVLGGRPEYNRPWGADEDAALNKMLDDGQTFNEAAEALGRTYAAIKNRVRKLKRAAPVVREEPAKPDPWAILPPNAFKDQKVTRDPAVPLSKPQDRTLAGVGTRMLVG